MPLPDNPRPPEMLDRFAAARAGASMTARVTRLQTGVSTRIADAAWAALHALGAHRWRDGYETDLERGWSRYRGSRCTICDEPWEGW